MIIQNLAVQRGQWLSFLCCYVVCEMEKTICPLRRLKFVLNFSAARGYGSTLLRTIFELFFPRVLL